MVMPDALVPTFASATEEDFERLLALRILVMRPHLERLGRFDPARARQRFRDGFAKAQMRLISVSGRFAGCVGVLADEAGLEVSNFYLAPDSQGQGLGGAVMAAILEEADGAGQRVRLQVLKLSPALRFYQRLGFKVTHEDDTDLYLARDPAVGLAIA
jgi:GNAT superfamily N-acetyltransferase